MQFFTFSILRFNSKQLPPYFTEEYRGYYFISNLEFITKEGKFDRKKYLGLKEDIFL